MFGRAFEKLGVFGSFGRFKCFGANFSFRHEAAQLLAPLEQILRFRAIERRPIKRRLDYLFVGQWNVESAAELSQFALVQFLLLMRDVSAFARFARITVGPPLCSIAALYAL